MEFICREKGNGFPSVGDRAFYDGSEYEITACGSHIHTDTTGNTGRGNYIYCDAIEVEWAEGDPESEFSLEVDEIRDDDEDCPDADYVSPDDEIRLHP